MSRKNRHITDLKYDSKRQIESLKRKTEALAVKWGGNDFLIESQLEQILDRFDEIIEDINGIDPNTH